MENTAHCGPAPDPTRHESRSAMERAVIEPGLGTRNPSRADNRGFLVQVYGLESAEEVRT
jgi:hypothetical protein